MAIFKKSLNLNVLGFLILLIVTLLFVAQNILYSKSIPIERNRVEFKGKILADKDLNAIALIGNYILLGGDEGNTLQVLAPNQKKSKYKVAENIELPMKEAIEAEIDLEGIAVSNSDVYVVGSHSINSESDSEEYDNRKSVFHFQLDPIEGKLNSAIAKTSLQKILERDSVLSPYANLTHQKNGVDIEGIAIKGDRLYFGFRTPILQGNLTPVLVVKFAEIDRGGKYELRQLNLAGKGIRDLVAVKDGFLILAAGTTDDDTDFQLYFWDGGDSSSGIKSLQEIPTAKKTRAEGLTILSETASSYQILVVYDGVAEGDPTIFEIPKG